MGNLYHNKCLFKMNILILFCLIFSPVHGLNLTPIVNLTSGPIQGKVTEYASIDVYQFLGIPYAKSPVGKLRLQLPVKPDPWTEVKSVTDFGPACLQPMNPVLNIPYTGKTSEDCLYLNIYVTESTFNNSSERLRPVLFWIHGGAFTFGYGNEGNTEGIPMVPLHDVVLVTMNYRLNAFGFIYFGANEPRIPPNIGFQDQLFALKWVHENIHMFGGDPNSVTIFGESAGSVSISAHLLSPPSKGLFKRAILESGTVYIDHDLDALITGSWELYNKTSCSKSEDVLECMQNLKAKEILNGLGDKLVAFSFTAGGDILPYEPSKILAEGLYDNSVDLLLGVEKNEASMFMNAIDPMAFNHFSPMPISYREATNFLERIFDSKSIDYFRELYFGPETNNSDYLRTQLERAYSDLLFVCPTFVFGHQYASNLGTNGGKVYAYYHTQRPKAYLPFFNEWMGTFHSSDIPYVFGLPLINPDYSQKDISLSREMMKIWTHFAENGEPPMVGETKWKPFQEKMSAMILNIDDWGKTETGRVEFCLKQWDYLYPHVSKKFQLFRYQSPIL
ncbi:acetylcholinesterase-like [Tetranychus urticae]|uniref:Carboxylic ester hydrolase n=1 Tax=Tetranychus urticae TaxID=32264 RepID=T1KPD9_TETUR|nr:acetylcholinesterase-like [Tetranychus urticae]